MSSQQIGVLAAVALGVNTGFSAYTAAREGEVQADANRYNQQVAESRADIERQQANVLAEQARDRAARAIATSRARFSASGVTGAGTPLIVEMDQAAEAALEADTIRYGGEMRSRAYQQEAKLQGFYGEQAIARGRMKAAGSILSGITSLGLAAAGGRVGAA